MNSLQITSFFKMMNARCWEWRQKFQLTRFEAFQHINRAGQEPLRKILNHTLPLITCWFMYSSHEDSGVDCGLFFFSFDIQDAKCGCFRGFASKSCSGTVFFHQK